METKRKKKTKKSEKKKNKKEKKKTMKKERRSAANNTDLKSSIPTRLVTESSSSEIDERNAFGPALPPHLVGKKLEASMEESTQIIGPNRDEFIKNLNFPLEKMSEGVEYTEENAEKSLIDTYGPLPVPCVGELSCTQLKLEERALQLKMAAFDGTLANSNTDQNVREEWMLELPAIGIKKGLASLSSLKRGFYQGKDKPDFSNRSAWTKTPNQNDMVSETEKPSTSKRTNELLKDAQSLYEKERDREQEAMAKKHEKKHKREKSLVEMHQKKLRKEQKKKEKEEKKNGSKPTERRPFSRDMDLKLNKIDRNQTKQIVDKAKILNTKFSSGQTKYL
uniref:DUF3752 domain-containing protein n=1 Tax=Glossina brevipalpis TaxID=37001 RepID=A0A1A9W6H8_9MUSC